MDAVQRCLLGLSYIQLFGKVGGMKSSHVSITRICTLCAGIGWLKSEGESHVKCPSCHGGGAVQIPIKRETYENQMDNLTKEISKI